MAHHPLRRPSWFAVVSRLIRPPSLRGRGLMAAPGALALIAAALAFPAAAAEPLPSKPPNLAQILAYPFVSSLTTAAQGDAVAWVETVRGVRNIWAAEGPDYKPRPLTRYVEDDGQELTQLTFSPDGGALVFVRGGDHDANWPAEGGLAPDPSANPDEPKVTIWSLKLAAPNPIKVAEGDEPALSSKGVLAFVKDHQIYTTALDGAGKPERLFFDRGKDGGPSWSPDGSKLAFVSNRGEHSFIGVYQSRDKPLVYLQPSTGRDDDLVWSPDSRRIAFTRQPGADGAPRPLLHRVPRPWSVWTADAQTGLGALIWRSPNTLDGSYPDLPGGPSLRWAAGDRLVFCAELDGWPHLYAEPAAGGAPELLTPGAFMVEDLTLSRDRNSVIFTANTGDRAGDEDRRHLFTASIDHPGFTALSPGDGLEWAPVATGAQSLAFIAAGPRRPPGVAIVKILGATPKILETPALSAYPAQALLVPKPVQFTAADGVKVEGQIFKAEDGGAPKPGVVFVHGGPPRQMLLGWHYMAYYSNAYAVNQYLALHGFVVLSVNYRLGIGYGRAFQEPDHAGFAGASEYQDVVAGARRLQATPGVDPLRIGIWGGSYGGYLTGLALARNSDLFKAGVDLHGVHDWSRTLAKMMAAPSSRYEQGDWAEAMRTAFNSSPDADVAGWRSPVLLIQGDDDRNVSFDQTVDLSSRLTAMGAPVEELVIPNEIHGFLRYASWLKADGATVDFLGRTLAAPAGATP